jgi:hypothetical protein
MSPESNMNINYNSFNVKKSQQSDNTNNYKDNYRLLKNDNRGKKSKQILNIEYNKKYDSEQNIDEYINDTKRNNKNYHNRYIPNNFRNNSYGKKNKINNDEQNNSENSLSIKYIRNQNNNNNIPRKKCISSNSTNIINFNGNINNNKDESSKLSYRIDDNFSLNQKNEGISRNKIGKVGGKYYINEYNKCDDNSNYYKHKNKSKNINYNSNSNKEILCTKNKNYNDENIDMKRRKLESNSSRYINTINNRENNYFRF